VNNHSHIQDHMQGIIKYFPELTTEQILRFEKMGALYTEWNKNINVISRNDINSLYERHILHSLAIAKIINFQSGSRILDVGTGGGFPGIPLAILFPDSDFVLDDSIGKKIKVVKAVADELELKNVTPLNERAENIKEKFDFIVSRAVTAFPQFVKLVRKNISPLQRNAIPNGIIYLKGGDFSEEIKGFAKMIETFEISSWFDEPFFETKKVIYLPIINDNAK
jgi:16S rRNA (guanine527-N7)-methyltransferase